MLTGLWQHSMKKKRRLNNEKEKTSRALAAIGIGMLVFATAGSTRATLTYLSDNYLAQIDVKSIGVTLIENGSDVAGEITSIRMMHGTKQQVYFFQICLKMQVTKRLY